VNATPQLWIATRGAQAVHGVGLLQLAQTPLWGMGKVIELEHPELRPRRVDLDPAADAGAQAASLLSLLAAGEAEPQLALRGAARYAARLVRSTAGGRAMEQAPLRLEKADSGVFDDMALRPLERRAPRAGEVEIRVIAAGLNFRDVMNAVAMRADPEPLGGECAGRVVAIGEGVTGLAVGDDVVAIAEACFATHAIADVRYVAPLPRGIGFAQGATLPFAFMTAHHALNVLGGMHGGSTVLVHAGAGGVGMAAIQLARRAGATVIATAGSDEKRAYLRSLGVAHVLGSRTLDFADEVLTLTQGRGVDLVLNSLAGDFIAASVRCLAEDGHLLEIGKRDIWTPEQFQRVRPRGRYHAIDLNAMRYQDADASVALFGAVMARVASGELAPLPLHAFPLTASAEAFRFMAQARHIGKIVLLPQDAASASLDGLHAQASYLVTGGLSGLGLLTAKRLAARGARHLMLMGRRAPGEAALADIAALREQGVQVQVAQADASNADDIARVLAQMEAGMPPLRGVVHSAGLLEDGALLQQRWDRFVKPLGPKVDGSWALHVLTQSRPLDFFVLYSSMASVLGSSGQGNHAAANAFMDGLAAHRRAQGLPALSISWGAWSEVGAAADRNLEQQVGARGMDVITPERGLQHLEALMRGQAPHVGVFPVRWRQFLGLDAGANVPCFLERMRDLAAAPAAPRAALAAPAGPAPSALIEQLKAASPGRRAELLLAFVGEHVARVVGAPSAQAIDPRQPLNEMGLDSLMAVELRNRLGTGLGLARSLPATLVFDHPTLEALARYLQDVALPPVEAVAAAPALAVAARADAVGAIDDMSDEQIEELFAKKLRR
jgi:NADPH:quinone reductase-like Zn-dependent oxidoreductase